MDNQFVDIVRLIKQSREQAVRLVNKALIDLYWNIGQYLHTKITSSEWGDAVVTELARYLQQTEPDLKGFSDKNLWRMKQFYETYKDEPKLSPLVREISWTNNLIVLSRSKTTEEKAFYLNLCNKEGYSKRELDRQISSGLYERTMIGNAKLSPVLREIHPNALNSFKDSYILDFLNLSAAHSESELQQGLVQQLKNFILELGKDFLFVAEEYQLQVGNSDFLLTCFFTTVACNAWWLLN